MEIDDLGVVEMFFQRDEVGVVDRVRIARELFGVRHGNLFFFREASVVRGLQGFPVIGRNPRALRGSQVMLQAVVALVDQRGTDVDQFVELALERAAYAGVEAQEGRSLERKLYELIYIRTSL